MKLKKIKKYPPQNQKLKKLKVINQVFFLKKSKILISKFCAIKNATPDPIATLIDIKSEKLVDTNIESVTPTKNPIYTICLANFLPYALLAKSVIKKVIG